MICDSCGISRAHDSKKCPNCGSAGMTSDPPRKDTGHLFYYNGYVVWRIHNCDNWYAGEIEYLFYKGQELIERIIVPTRVIQEFVGPRVSAMPFVWNLFLLAQGDEDMLCLTGRGDENGPAKFEIRRAPPEQEEYFVRLHNGQPLKKYKLVEDVE